MDQLVPQSQFIIEALAGRLIAGRRAGLADQEALNSQFLEGFNAGLATPYFRRLAYLEQTQFRRQLDSQLRLWVSEAIALANRADPPRPTALSDIRP
jgi:hypothetical protein